MKSEFYKNGKLIGVYYHKPGIAFEDVKEIMPEMLQKYPYADEVITISKTKGSFVTKANGEQIKTQTKNKKNK